MDEGDFKGENRILVEGSTEDTGYLDLYLMSKCKHNIIANSSFELVGRMAETTTGEKSDGAADG